MFEKVSSVRNSNLELLRIVAMMGIILSHYHFFLGELMEANPTSLMSIYHYSIGMGGKIGINVFMLITGYFMCTKEISAAKFVRLLAQIYFYCILIQGLFMIMGAISVNRYSVLDMLFPFYMLHMDCFIADFMWFYLFIPFVRILIENITRKQHFILILLSLIVFIGYNTLPGFYTQVNPITWFIVLMFIASYVRLYNPRCLQVSFLKMGGVTLFLIICAIISIVILVRMGKFPRVFFAEANSILGFSIAFSLFITFLNLKIGFNKYINLYGGAAFGVLLIHSNCWPMRELIFKDIIDTQQNFLIGNWWAPLFACPAIYFVCGTMEIIRKNTIEQPILNVLYTILKIEKQLLI